MKHTAREHAIALKRLLQGSSPLIEAITRELCPGCREVCCKQKHGVFRKRDVVYLTLLGEDVPEQDRLLPGEGPCMFMGDRGCTRPRWFRPFRCTWYFCDQLCALMGSLPWKESKRISDMMHEMIGHYQSLPDVHGKDPSVKSDILLQRERKNLNHYHE